MQASLATKSAYRQPCLSHFIVFLFSYRLVALKPQRSVFPTGAFCSSQIIQRILQSTAVFHLPFLSSGLFPFTDFILHLPTNVTNITRNGKEEFCPCCLVLLFMGKAKDLFCTMFWPNCHFILLIPSKLFRSFDAWHGGWPYNPDPQRY